MSLEFLDGSAPVYFMPESAPDESLTLVATI